MPDLATSNGQAVMLGREFRVRISPAHQKSLEGLAKVHGWASPTILAEALLTKAIEDSAKNTVFRMLLDYIVTVWH